MIALFSFLIIVFFSLVVVRIGAIALESTGLSSDLSRFQSLSAFSGVGFTTNEAEMVMNTVLRRKIIRILIMLGSAGLTTGLATLILTFIDSGKNNQGLQPFLFNIMIVVFGAFFLFLISRTILFDKLIRLIMKHPLKVIRKRVSVYDYENLLGMSKGFGVVQFQVSKGNWMVNRTIKDLKLEKEGINVLGVFRDVHKHQEYIGLPSNDFKIHPNDKMVIYCRENMVEKLSKRESGKKGMKSRKEAELYHKKLNLINKLDEDKLKQILKNN